MTRRFTSPGLARQRAEPAGSACVRPGTLPGGRPSAYLLVAGLLPQGLTARPRRRPEGGHARVLAARRPRALAEEGAGGGCGGAGGGEVGLLHGQGLVALAPFFLLLLLLRLSERRRIREPEGAEARAGRRRLRRESGAEGPR